MILADASGLTALLDARNSDHDRCARAIGAIARPLVTTWPAFTEAMYLLGRGGWSAQEQLWRIALRRDLEVADLDGASIERAHALMNKYRDVPMALADATLVALAEARELSTIFTLDADFRVYRLHGRKRFDLVLDP